MTRPLLRMIAESLPRSFTMWH